MSPRVSIIMNCYNGEKFLKYSLLSILNQSYKNWELIFWDNKSNDRSKKIFKSFKDGRFKYFFAQNHTNLYKARNLAITKAKGEIITFLDVDDLWLKNKLKLQVPLFKNKKINLVYGNYLLKNHLGIIKKKLFKFKKLPSGFITNELLEEYFIGLLTIAIRQKAILKYKEIFNSELNLISDFDFVLNFSLENKIKSIQNPIAVYRLHPGQQQRKSFFLQAEDFCKWFALIKDKKKFYKLPNFFKLKQRAIFFHYVLDIKKKNFLNNFINLLKIKNFKLKIKLIILLIFKNIAIKYFFKVH
jgi:glycosyltransferase involved in cell wall biosynthesis